MTALPAGHVIPTGRPAIFLGVDGFVGLLLFLSSAIWGGVLYTRAVTSGPHPFFYQSYFEPAVMTACGKGFFITQPQPAPPALRAFLLEQTDRFSCDELPHDLKVGTAGLYQRPWRYLMTTVAVAWMVLGISWSGLAPLFGVLFGATTVLVFGVSRLVVGRLAAVGCAAALAGSSLQLTNLPNLRDYAKAPFTLALVLILIALAVRPVRKRDVLLLSLCYGLVMGIGYGFRTDLLIDIPPFLITMAVFFPGGVLHSVRLKAAALLLFAGGFLAAGWPIITTVVSSGGCQWHVFLLGLTSPFNDGLGVRGGVYGWGHLYKDEYVWAAVSSYANRLRPDLGYIEYCSQAYDVASRQYLRHILVTFPADMVTRAYASALQVLNMPYQRFAVFNHAGPLLAAAFVLVIGASSVRLALFAGFTMLYFGGYPAIQFLPRHYFPFEFIGWLALAFLLERTVHAATGALNGRPVLPVSASVRNVAVCAVLIAGLLLVPLGILRWYQNGSVTRLLTSYVTAPTSQMPLVLVAPGQLRLPIDHTVPRLSAVEATATLGQPRTRFVEAVFNGAACRLGTTVTFRYDPTYPDTDFSRTVMLQPVAGSEATRLFEPVYSQFQGIDVSDPSATCLQRVFVLTQLDKLPLLLSVQLPPEWQSRPQYQRIVTLP